MHTCPRCGYEPPPTPTTLPVIDRGFGGTWRVMVWTEESDHRWVKECNTAEEAHRVADELKELYLKRNQIDPEEVLETVASEQDRQL